jgi:hypothetical protein
MGCKNLRSCCNRLNRDIIVLYHDLHEQTIIGSQIKFEKRGALLLPAFFKHELHELPRIFKI